MSNIKNKKASPSLLYHLFKGYIRLLHDGMFYRKTYVVNKQAVPEDGTPLLIVSNHQNCMNDPLAMVCALADRKLNVITRADVFMVSPVANRFLRAIGLLPAFRLDYEGESALDKNTETFRASEKALIDGASVLMYPEAGHQDKRWLGTFSLGYTKMAFEAAEMANFEKELYILPACNHYSHYFGWRNRVLVKLGTPIALSPYYELYKVKPRTAQREVNKLVREQISSLMLDIRDLDNYDAIDFVRITYGRRFAARKGFHPNDLPNRLLTDKELVVLLDECQEREDIYAQARSLKQGIEQLGINDNRLAKEPNPMTLGVKLLLLMAMLPMWIVSWWPAMPVYGIPMAIFKAKMKDPMFEGTLLFGSAALFTLPLFSLATLLTVGLSVGWLPALAYVAAFAPLMLFCGWYARAAKRTWQAVKCMLHPKETSRLKQMRTALWQKLDEVTATSDKHGYQPKE